jgi:hypothetical protein
MKLSGMNAAPVLLVVGIHREELAFGQTVAESLDRQRVQVLTVPEGLSGKRPLQGQQFKYNILHEALYLQLLPSIRGKHDVLLDLHTGSDPAGPSADLICSDGRWRTGLAEDISRRPGLAAQNVRIVALGGESPFPHAHTVIPREIWDNPAFAYLGMEIYLPDTAEGRLAALDLARELVEIVAARAAGMRMAQMEPALAQQRLPMRRQMNPEAGDEQSAADGMPSFLPGRRKG